MRISNKNRQIGALDSTLSISKVEIMSKRIIDINPNCNVITIYDSINKNNYIDLLKDKDIIIDSVDGKDNKLPTR